MADDTTYTVVQTLHSLNSATVQDGVEYAHNIVVPLPQPVHNVVSVTPCSVDPTLGNPLGHNFVLLRIDDPDTDVNTWTNPRKYLPVNNASQKTIDYLFKVSGTSTERPVEELCLHSIPLHCRSFQKIRMQLIDPEGNFVVSPHHFTVSLTFTCSTSKTAYHLRRL